MKIFDNQTIKKFLNGHSIHGFTRDSFIVFLDNVFEFSSKSLLVAVENEKTSFDLYSRFFEHRGKDALFFPSSNKETPVPGFLLEEERFRKESLIFSERKKAGVFFGTKTSFKKNDIKPEETGSIISTKLKIGQELEIEDYIESLMGLGYSKENLVFSPEEFSIRGDIVDVFPSTFKNPVRVSFNMGTVERISLFNPTDQTSVGSLDKLNIYEQKNNTQVIENINFTDRVLDHFLINVGLKENRFYAHSCLGEKKLSLKITELKTPDIKREGIKNFLLDFYEKSHRTFLVEKEKKNSTTNFLKDISYHSTFGSIESSFFLMDERVLVLSSDELFYSYNPQNRWQPKSLNKRGFFQEGGFEGLSIGELIVHSSFGIGIYRGVFNTKNTSPTTESIKIEYKNGNVFVSLDQLYLVHRYVGNRNNLKISSLGTKSLAE